MGLPRHRSSILLAVIAVLYIWIFTSVFAADELAPVPNVKHQRGLNLTNAFYDLHQITARPRPYNSHANDAARAYILRRIRDITHGHSFVHVSNDLTSNATFARGSGRVGVYFEGTNILVKVDGLESDSKTGGVLFSAHYDSVSTAKGVSDNAMSVVACMQMIEYLVHNRPKRTAVFNINNGEEDGLYGAQVFIQHPWFAIVDTFMNVEGAAAGGRPLIFRSTSYDPLRSFQRPFLAHPHTNVLSSDAFFRGLVRSSTDFSVYIKGLDTSKTDTRYGPKQGVDIAFYKHRSFYHTKYDSLPFTEGGKRALWAMMDVVRGAGWELLERNDSDIEGSDDGGVYYDLFGKYFVLFTQRALLICSIILLVVGPVSILTLVFMKAIIVRRVAQRQRHLPTNDWSGDGVWQSTKRWLRLTILSGNGAGIKTRFWFALVLNILLQVLLVWAYLNINPYIMYSHPFTVFTTSTLLAFVTLASSLSFHHPDHSLYADRKQSILLQLYVLTYVLALASTPLLAGVNGPGVGGVYFIIALHVCVWLGSLVGCAEVIMNARHGFIDETVVEEIEESERETSSVAGPREDGDGRVLRNGRLLVSGVRFEMSEEEGEATNVGPDGTRQGVIIETDPTEITPLIPPSTSGPHSPRNALDELSDSAGVQEGKYDRFIPWTAIQLALVVPLPVVLMVHIVVLLMNAMAESLADGSAPVVVYAASGFLSSLIVLPLMPFVLPSRTQAQSRREGRKHIPSAVSLLTLIALILFVLTTVYAMAAFPFSQQVPLKLFFQQKVEVDLSPGPITRPGPNLPAPPIPPPNIPTIDPEPPSVRGKYSPLPLRVQTSLTGLGSYTLDIVRSSFPSAFGTGIVCQSGNLKRSGLKECSWDVTDRERMWPSPIVRRPADYQEYNTGAGMLKNPVARGTKDWLRVRTRRLEGNKILIGVQGVNSRACRIYANDRTIRKFRVHPSDGESEFPSFEDYSSLAKEAGGWEMQPGYEIPADGLGEVRLWSRSWDREFVVELEWEVSQTAGTNEFGLRSQHPALSTIMPLRENEGGDESLYFEGRVACEWSEYESSTIGESGRASRGARIPAYEEVLANLPKWAVASKRDDGLVEVWGKIVV